ncbi:galactarate dehydratase [Celerinatantimonas yamalensis]|uniref:Galactarate dehydratase n=1 Tax=Celerinatantimonas yamalensis TaxID=559956 RepID=A0ABW9G926_9GAMM
METQSVRPILIQVDQCDNVAIIANEEGLEQGTMLSNGIFLQETIPMGHKVTLADLAQGDAIRRYNQVIGYASEALPAGSWVHQFRVELPKAPQLDELVYDDHPPQTLSPLEGYYFDGYRNPDGSVGTKNLLAVTTTVHCVAGVVDYIVERIEKQLLPHYPNVDGVVALNHLYGCGVAINAPAAVVPIRTLHNLAKNPNFGSEVLVVGLGCEKLQPELLLNAEHEPIAIPKQQIIMLQDEKHHGFQSMVNEVLTQANVLLGRLNQRSRERCPVSNLVVGMQCGGSDAFSGVTANPAVGYASDLLVRCGATVMFSEVTEVRDAIHLLVPRAANAKVASDLIAQMRWYDNYLAAGQTDRSANPSPGNKKGGLANVVEKALGSIAKSGTSAIVEVIAAGERPQRKGLIFAATPASDFVCGTQQLASGITLQVFTTGRGTPYGLKAIPVIKMATNSALAHRWDDLIDMNAGTIAEGLNSIEQIGQQLFEMILAVASGRHQTWAERWGLYNQLSVFNPAPIT